MKKNFLFIIFASFLFIACSSKENVELKTNNKLPSWYIKPSANNSLYLYGVAEGENLDKAIKSALISISSKLSLSIKSNSTLEKKSTFKYREYISKEYIENINSSTQELIFQDYKVKNIYNDYKNVFVEVEIKKSNLIETLKTQIEQLISNYYIKKSSLKNKDPYSKYLSYKKANKNLTKYINKVQILKTLDSSYKEGTFYKILKESKIKQEEFKNKTSFYIENEGSYPLISSKIKSFLTKERFVFKKNGNYKIKIDSFLQTKDARGIFIAENSITIGFIYKNSTIKSYTSITKGISSNSIKDSVDKSFQNFDYNFK